MKDKLTKLYEEIHELNLEELTIKGRLSDIAFERERIMKERDKLLESMVTKGEELEKNV